MSAQKVQTLHTAKASIKYFPVHIVQHTAHSTIERQTLIKATIKSAKEQNHQRHFVKERVVNEVKTRICILKYE